MVVITDDPAAWASLVADRNASGQRTALLLAEAGDQTAGERAATMAEEVFMAAAWQAVDLRAGIARPG